MTVLPLKRLLLPGLLALLLLIAYLPLLAGGDFLHWDDNYQITNNADLRLGLSAIPKIFSSFYLDMYQPLTTMNYWLDFKLWGLNAIAFHLLSLAWHLLNAYLVFLLLRKLKVNKELSLVSCLLFALWPTQAEAVSWLSARSTLLSTTGALLSMLLYLKNQTVKQTKFYWLSFAFFIAAMLAKISVAGLWLLLPFLADRERLPDIKAWIKTWPFALASFCLMSWATVGRHLSTQQQPADYQAWYIPNVAYSFWSTLLNIIWPFRLSPLYPHPNKVLAIAALLSLVALGCYTLWAYWRGKRWTIWLIWVIALLGPSAAIAPRLISITANRYSYLAGLPVLMLIVLLVSRLTRHWLNLKYPAFGLLIIIAIFGTIDNAGAWTDDLSLWNKAVDSQPDQCWTWYNRATVYKINKGFEAALPDLRQAVDHCPTDPQISNLVAGLMLDNGRYQEALYYLRNALAARDEAATHYNVGMAYIGLKKLPEACAEITKAQAVGAQPDKAVLKFCPSLKLQ